RTSGSRKFRSIFIGAKYARTGSKVQSSKLPLVVPRRKSSLVMRRAVWICLALAAITVAVYSPVIHYDFLTFDDQIYVTENPYVRSGLNGNSLAWAFHSSASG